MFPVPGTHVSMPIHEPVAGYKDLANVMSNLLGALWTETVVLMTVPLIQRTKIWFVNLVLLKAILVTIFGCYNVP